MTASAQRDCALSLTSPGLCARIGEFGEAIDRHRKQRQQLFPDLTATGMYNVLESLRQGQKLLSKEREIHEQGSVSGLGELHDELDAAVFEAYGLSDLRAPWPKTLPEQVRAVREALAEQPGPAAPRKSRAPSSAPKPPAFARCWRPSKA